MIYISIVQFIFSVFFQSLLPIIFSYYSNKNEFVFFSLKLEFILSIENIRSHMIRLRFNVVMCLQKKYFAFDKCSENLDNIHHYQMTRQEKT